MENKIAHVAIATENLEEAKLFFEMISGNSASEVREVSSQKLNISFIKIGETNFELLEPIGEDTPITKFLNKSGGGIHHICIETDNFDDLIQKIKSTGVRTLGDPSIGAKDRRVIFFHPKDTFNVLVELEEA